MIDEGIFRKARSFQNIKYRSGPSSFEDNFVVSSDTKIFFIASILIPVPETYISGN